MNDSPELQAAKADLAYALAQGDALAEDEAAARIKALESCEYAAPGSVNLDEGFWGAA